jgi:hypothetical protein
MGTLRRGEVRINFLPRPQKLCRYNARTVALKLVIPVGLSLISYLHKIDCAISMHFAPGSAVMRLYRASELISLKLFTRGMQHRSLLRES